MGEMVQCSYICILLWLRSHFVSCMNPTEGDGHIWGYQTRLNYNYSGSPVSEALADRVLCLFTLFEVA